MVIVRHNQWSEFLEELEAHPPEDHIVRLTFSLRYDKQEAAHLTMVAGYVNQGSIVEFVHYLGLQPTDQRSSRAEEIQKLLGERRTHIESLGFRVASGRYHVPPNLQR